MRPNFFSLTGWLIVCLLGCSLLGDLGPAATVAAPRGFAKLQPSARDLRNISNIGKAIIANAVTTGRLLVAGGSEEERPGLSWRVHLLPELGEQELYEQFHLDEPWDSEHNLTLIEQMPDVFLSRGQDNEPGHTHYQVVTGEDTWFHGGDGQSMIAIATNDGWSSTILLVEADNTVTWTAPEDWEFTAEAPFQNLGGLREDGTFLAVFADGSVRALSTEMTGDTLHALLTPNGRETIQASDLNPSDE